MKISSGGDQSRHQRVGCSYCGNSSCCDTFPQPGGKKKSLFSSFIFDEQNRLRVNRIMDVALSAKASVLPSNVNKSLRAWGSSFV